ncbi:MAG: hypothetical protein KGY76_04505, partial [Candidatus Thermoplasmatota archaeon]|nr:hypothetical protein [Candidatus Thermoplasmatota archaeon]
MKRSGDPGEDIDTRPEEIRSGKRSSLKLAKTEQLFYDDFSTDKNWWEWNTSSYYSWGRTTQGESIVGSYSMNVGDADGDLRKDGEGAYTHAPAIYLPTDPSYINTLNLTFQHTYNFEEVNGATPDGGRVEIRGADNGSWDGYTPEGGYPGMIEGYGNPLRYEDGYVGNSSGWVDATFIIENVENYIQHGDSGDYIELRWRMGMQDLANDTMVSWSHWDVDDVEVTAYYNEPTVTISYPQNDYDTVSSDGFSAEGTYENASSVYVSVYDHDVGNYTSEGHANSSSGSWTYWIPSSALNPGHEIEITAQGYNPVYEWGDWVNRFANVEEPSYAVTVYAPPDQTEASSGTYTYSYDVENPGGSQDTYDLTATASQSGWSASSQQSSVTVSSGGTETVNVDVSIPTGVGGESCDVTLEATSQNDNTVSDSDFMTVTLQENLGVTVSAPSDSTESSSGTYTYSYDVQNDGNTQDTYDLTATASQSGWSASSQRSSVTVSPGGTETVNVDVSIPTGAGGESCDVTLEAASQSDTTVSDSDFMTVTLQENLVVTVTAPSDRTESSSGTYTYSYEVENNGNTEDTYDLTAAVSQSGWSASSDQASVTVSPGAIETVNVDVTIPSDASDGENSDVTLTADSQGGTGVSDSDTMTVTYSTDTVRDVAVDAPSNSTEKDTGVFEYTFDVVNTGNVEDTYSLTADSTGWSVDTPSSVSVEAGATEPVKVNVTIPSDAADGD